MPDQTPVQVPDIVIIGSGMGGATLAAGLAGSGLRVLILEKGDHLKDTPETRDVRAIFQRGFFRPRENWLDKNGRAFNPGNYYVVGGNSKFYGAVLFRYRKEDFAELSFPEGGVSPAWPFSYDELEPYYSKAEQLYQVRGTSGEDATEPYHSEAYPLGPVPDEPAIAVVRNRLKKVGLNPASLPLGVDIERWLKRAATPFDAYPDTLTGKMDAESCGLATALKDRNIKLQTNSDVLRLETDENNKISAIVYRHNGEEKKLSPKLVVLSAGAVRSSVLLLRSANENNPNGIANSSDQVGRNFMNHNATFMLAVDPFTINDSIYQKTIHFNDFYFGDGHTSGPMGQVQLLGRVTAPILKTRVPFMPEWALNILSRRAVDWYLVSEDLPRPESRVRINGDQIILDWQPSNMEAHKRLVTATKAKMKAAGYPIILSQLVDGRLPSHQCGTVRMGLDPKTAVLNPYCQSWDHENLYVVDAGCLPTSAAVNPSLTVAAQALRVANHIRTSELVA
ncbi:MAG: GMC oxidoreductase [Notoacmeibacter sp.]